MANMLIIIGIFGAVAGAALVALAQKVPASRTIENLGSWLFIAGLAFLGFGFPMI